MVTDITLVYKYTQANILLTVHMLYAVPQSCSLSLFVSEWDKESDSQAESFILSKSFDNYIHLCLNFLSFLFYRIVLTVFTLMLLQVFYFPFTKHKRIY